MAEAFFQLQAEERREVLAVAADRSGRPAHLLEKDVWVVWTLGTLYRAPLGEQLVFKGGTSLSKAYGAIRRFSEDVDLTYDIRELASDLVEREGPAIPKSRSEEKRWSKAVRDRLPGWIENSVRPLIMSTLDREGISATTRTEGDKLFIDYPATATGTGYVTPSVMLEFGARSSGHPATPRDIRCDASEFVEGVEFPTARPQVMHAERTFWEKATAIHVFCLQQRMRGHRFARHWHDLVRLDEVGIADTALTDRQLAKEVAQHKSMFFFEKAADSTPIDYTVAVSGALRLVPDGQALRTLEEDYARMVEDGLLLGDAEPFDALMERCGDIAERANRLGA